MTDEKKTYTVTDRRHFTRDGEAAAAATEPAQEPTAYENVAPAPRSPVDAPEVPADFAAFVMSLGAQASVLLGGVEGVEPDLKGAKWLISILEMLRDKTEGRRTADETEALDAILYELRLAYVSRVRAGGA